MDQRLLDYYDRELRYLRELGGEFAAEFPEVARQLDLSAVACADPYVERLLEGFAFLAARVHLKLDAEFPRFTEHLFEMVFPNYLAPMPSVAVARFMPDQRQAVLTQGFEVPRGAMLRTSVGGPNRAPCTFVTGQPVTLWPLEITSLRHTIHTGDLVPIQLDTRKVVRSTLRIGIRAFNETPLQQIALQHLPLHVVGQDAAAIRLFELLNSAAIGIMVKPEQGGNPTLCPTGRVAPLGFADNEALLPAGSRLFHGYRLLQEYFALPARFAFLDLQNLAPGLAACADSRAEIVILLDRHEPLLESAVAPSQLAPYCTPVVNLFEQVADRIPITNREHEYHVVVDRTRPLDFEVHSITEVMGHGSSANQRREFRPFYCFTDRSVGNREPSYYTSHRQPRIPSSKQKRAGARSSYPGSEVFVSLVDGLEGPYAPDLRQLSVSTLCTNRDLPLALLHGTEFSIDSGAPVAGIRCVAGPSSPRAAHAWGPTSWRLISHLSLNYLSLTDNLDGRGAASLRELLQLYGDLAEPSVQRQIEGVKSISSAPIVRRLPFPGPVSYGRGLEVSLELDERAFEGTGVCLLGAVLDRFFSKYVAINSFTELALRTSQRGEIIRWPARLGGRPLV
jgi:type VI secretion system protein ImpG